MLCLITEKLCYGPQVSFHYEKKNQDDLKGILFIPFPSSRSLFTLHLPVSQFSKQVYQGNSLHRKILRPLRSDISYDGNKKEIKPSQLLTMPIYHIWAPRFTSWLYPSKCSAHKVLGNGSCAVWRSKWSLWLLVSGWPSSLRSRHWGSKPLHGSSLYLLLKKQFFLIKKNRFICLQTWALNHYPLRTHGKKIRYFIFF